MKTKFFFVSDPLVRDILLGHKNEIREPFPFPFDDPETEGVSRYGSAFVKSQSGGARLIHCPYSLGDKIIGFEEWAPMGDGGGVWYKAGIPEFKAGKMTGRWLDFPYETATTETPNPNQEWLPAKDLPRHAWRVVIEVEDIRISLASGKREWVIYFTLL